MRVSASFQLLLFMVKPFLEWIVFLVEPHRLTHCPGYVREMHADERIHLIMNFDTF